MSWLRRLVDPNYEEVEMPGIRAARVTGADEQARPGWRKVTLYVSGEEFGMWFPGDSIAEVNEVVKAWLIRGDDDQDLDDDISSRIASFPAGDVLFSFRRSWVSGYKISIQPGEIV